MADGLVVVDTDLVIDFLRARGPGAAFVRKLVQERRLRLTAVTAFELRFGTDFHERSADIMRLCHRRVLPIRLREALRAGEVQSALRALGQPIGEADCLIAGTCLARNLPLATRNRRHFERVEGLELLDL